MSSLQRLAGIKGLHCLLNCALCAATLVGVGLHLHACQQIFKLWGALKRAVACGSPHILMRLLCGHLQTLHCLDPLRRLLWVLAVVWTSQRGLSYFSEFSWQLYV